MISLPHGLQNRSFCDSSSHTSGLSAGPAGRAMPEAIKSSHSFLISSGDRLSLRLRAVELDGEICLTACGWSGRAARYSPVSNRSISERTSTLPESEGCSGQVIFHPLAKCTTEASIHAADAGITPSAMPSASLESECSALAVCSAAGAPPVRI